MTEAMTRLQTPCFIFDTREFERGIDGFDKALDRLPGNHIIGYSVKTNSLPAALAEAGRRGCYAEVVSHDEYRLARLCGFSPDKIIYNGPMKSKETFIEAIVGNAIVNIETKRELDWLSELPRDTDYKVGLRLNINISKISAEDADGEDDNSRFGFSQESGEFAEAIQIIDNLPNVQLSGLHIHRTTHSRNPKFYERSIAYALYIAAKHCLALDYLDIGGGYFGIFSGKPTFDDYAAAFIRGIGGNRNIKIIVEPGNALTASAFSFLSRVIDCKTVDTATHFVTTDGSRNDVDPFFHKNDYLKEIHRLPGDNRSTVDRQIITGCSCLEYDRLFTLKNEMDLRVGDYIKYNNVGAYTMTLSPQFIRLWPAVYSFDGTTYRLVRRASDAQDILATSLL